MWGSSSQKTYILIDINLAFDDRGLIENSKACVPQSQDYYTTGTIKTTVSHAYTHSPSPHVYSPSAYFTKSLQFLEEYK